ncbi:membrane protein insertase YidC [Eggerthella guodeyinii]|uniref:Membrane protein insertase YidC n=1 Tax=Eggerthella guodeyinii TaxID=2690837 RepID=A0A6L7IWI5_9ACTN|nr:membrane protein insertase YidC [Eggerthella guodeyinii]QOS67177.1 membrane protein insertase YidC [Eggerthella guodeyinii]
MLDAFASLLWLIVQPCYDLTGNWWIAILLFTVIIKLLMLPLSLWVQKSAILMVQLMPALNRINVKFFGDREAIGEAQSALYKEKHYHPMVSLVPLVIQILILFGLVEVVHWITDGGAPGTEFMGMVPIEDGGASWTMPLLAGLSAVVMGFAQNRINPLQKEQPRAEKNMTNGLSIGLSFILGVFVATGMGFYWVVSNLMSIIIQALCNVIIKPAKYIDYAELEASRDDIEALHALEAGRKKRRWFDPLSKREKADYKRFFNTVNKHIVFYSESSGFYKYFKGAVEWLLKNSDAPVHYVTNDPDDQIFELAKREERIKPYFIGQKKTITLMMKMDADVVVTTQEDLDNYYNKRSYVRKDVEYVFMFHHMTSTHMTATRESYDNYDAIMCVGPHQVRELRRAEELRDLPKKELVECGYGLMDEIVADYERGAATREANERPVVMIAPSWQEDCILDSCIDEMLESLLGHGYRIVVRPHPEYTKRYGARWEALVARYGHVSEDELCFEEDFSRNDSVLSSDILITDWSSIPCEFCFATKKPAVFVDTTMKVANPDYLELGIEPTDISLRNQIGRSVPVEEVPAIGKVVERMLATQDEWKDAIERVLDGFVFNLGHGGEVAGEYLLGRMLAKQEEKKQVDHA